MKTSFTSQLFKKEGKVWDTTIYIPKCEAAPYIDKDNKRVICTINGSFSFHAVLMPQGNGDSFINVNGEIRKKLRLET